MKFYQFVLAGLAGALVLVALFYLAAYDKAARLDGEITEVRTVAMDERASVAIVDFQAVNNSDILFVSGERKLIVIDERGIRHEGTTTSAFDLKQLFKYFKGLGEMENEPFIRGIEVEPGESISGILAARFEMSKTALDTRQEIILQIADVDGSISEFSLESEEVEPE